MYMYVIRGWRYMYETIHVLCGEGGDICVACVCTLDVQIPCNKVLQLTYLPG